MLIKSIIILSILLITSASAKKELSGCPTSPYVYYADVVSVYDADTITVNIDLGFHTWRNGERLRLFGIDAYEVKGKEKKKGKAARDWLRGQALGKRVIIKSIKHKKRHRGKFGRYLAELYSIDNGKCVNLNHKLVKLGYAVYRDY